MRLLSAIKLPRKIHTSDTSQNQWELAEWDELYHFLAKHLAAVQHQFSVLTFLFQRQMLSSSKTGVPN